MPPLSLVLYFFYVVNQKVVSFLSNLDLGNMLKWSILQKIKSWLSFCCKMQSEFIIYSVPLTTHIKTESVVKHSEAILCILYAVRERVKKSIFVLCNVR